MALDLDHYFRRIHYRGPRAASLETLRALHLAHTCAIPFENLDVLLGRTIQVDEDSVFEKLVIAGRGGWCFEQNGLFRNVLAELGFEVENLSGRVLLANPPQMPARSHRLTKVTLDGEAWIADVGFGGKTLPAPVRLVEGELQATTHGVYSLERVENDWLLKFHGDDKIINLYRFNLEPQYLSDYEMGNHYVATWPQSHFRHCLTLSLYLPNGEKNTLYSAGENAPAFESAEQLYHHLQSDFNLRLDHPRHGIQLEEFSTMLERIGVIPHA
ncbi:N-hydroxyarylamine O-acetyltransferase [Cedecea davisae]|uniref:Putative N-hydroxyarylamine O-acetyltransferase n=1 Tax=Cedecea davisae DSM 4568 TaxID=566551 RepID=S3J9U2_9ENTR|nr:arylamine N-acetyltransferase [Cedecea davisae]EPF16897.1 putative N-hydroxyarylamine O-acetyltransferase [Cedecea davisae DSM 4568]SUX27675.1 N-hydroxyarylamine O-acetyltransferase [Cedecea davisae]